MRRRCAATGKIQYKRHQDAAKQLARAAKAYPVGAQVPHTSYRCSECGKWHLTGLAGDEGRALAKAHRDEHKRHHAAQQQRQAVRP